MKYGVSNFLGKIRGLKFFSEIRGVKFIWVKIRGLKFYSGKIRGLKILGTPEENTPGG